MHFQANNRLDASSTTTHSILIGILLIIPNVYFLINNHVYLSGFFMGLLLGDYVIGGSWIRDVSPASRLTFSGDDTGFSVVGEGKWFLTWCFVAYTSIMGFFVEPFKTNFTHN